MAAPDDDELFGFDLEHYVCDDSPRYKEEMRRREEEAEAWEAQKARRQELLGIVLSPLLFLLTPYGLVWLVFMAAGFLVPYEHMWRWVYWASWTMIIALNFLFDVFKSGGL